MPAKKPEQIDISYKTFVKFFLVLGGVAAVYFISDILAALLFAVVTASAIEPWILRFKKRGIPRIASVIFIYLSAFFVLAFLLYLVIPVIIAEFNSFQANIYSFQEKLFSGFKSYEDSRFGFFLDDLQRFLANGPIDFSQFAGGVVGILSFIFGGFMSVTILVVVSFYLAAQENSVENFLRLMVPVEYEEYTVDLWSRSQGKMGRWLRGQMILALLVGVLVFIALTVLEVKYALLFAITAALLETIPVIGPILSAVPAVFVTFIEDPILGGGLILLYFMIQQIESQLFVPIIMKRTVGLNPLIVIIAILVGARFGGILGIFLAVPVASILVEFIMDTDKKKRGLFQAVHNGETAAN